MNLLRLLVYLILVLLFAAAPLRAQDDAPLEATPIVTINGTPAVIADELPPPPLDIDIVMPPDVEPEPREIPSDVIMIAIIAVSTIIIVGMVLYARHQGITPQAAFQRLPGVLTEYGYPAAWNYRYGVARGTPSPADDVWLKQEAAFLGYKVTERADGSVLLERDPAHIPPMPPAPGPVNFPNVNRP